MLQGQLHWVRLPFHPWQALSVVSRREAADGYLRKRLAPPFPAQRSLRRPAISMHVGEFMVFTGNFISAATKWQWPKERPREEAIRNGPGPSHQGFCWAACRSTEQAPCASVSHGPERLRLRLSAPLPLSPTDAQAEYVGPVTKVLVVDVNRQTAGSQP
jgi:hypothetical protein